MPPRLASGNYFGDTLRRRRVADVILTETRYAPHSVLPAHCHEHAYFCLVRRGGYAETYGSQQQRTCGPMTLAYHPPEEVHVQRFAGVEVRSFNVELTPAWWRRLGPSPALRLEGADLPSGHAASLAMRLQQELRHFDSASPLAVEGLVLELLAAVLRSAADHTSPPAWLLRARDRLRDEFADPPAVADLAAEAGVHPGHLIASFRNHFRQSAGEFVRQRRVEWACRQLDDTELSLAELALAAGFADQSHFGRTFKRIVGVTPAAYRKQLP